MEEVKQIRTVYQGNIFSVEEIDINFGNGNYATFERVAPVVTTGVSALVVDIKEQVLLVNQFRAGINQKELGLPSGGLNANENPESRIQSELQEEIGYRANNLKLMCKSHSMSGYVKSIPSYIYLAQDLIASAKQGDELEDIEVVKIPYHDLYQMVGRNEIMDSRIIISVLYYHQFYKMI